MYPAETELKKILVYEIEHAFGRKILSSRDCIELSEEIFVKTKHQLNSNTLRRFFDLVKAAYPPSRSTLTILSKYCGFQSVEDIYKIKNTGSMTEGIINAQSVLHYMVAMFRDIVVKEKHDQTFLHLAIQTIKLLNANEFLSDKFQSLIAKTENGCTYYFEQLINVDKLNSFYGNGLRYYLKEKGTPEAQILTGSLYVFKYWLSNESEKLEKSFAAFIATSLISPDINVAILARRYAAQLYVEHIRNSDNEQTKLDVYGTYMHFVRHNTLNENHYSYAYVLSEAFFLTGQYQDAIFFIEEAKEMFHKLHLEDYPLHYVPNLKVLETYALLKIDKPREAEKVYDEIRSSEFPFLNKQLYSILYLLLSIALKTRDNQVKNEKHLRRLIDDTGFKRFLL